jgi:hypothetical protein
MNITQGSFVNETGLAFAINCYQDKNCHEYGQSICYGDFLEVGLRNFKISTAFSNLEILWI